MRDDRQTHRFDVIAGWLAGQFPAAERRTMTVLDVPEHWRAVYACRTR